MDNYLPMNQDQRCYESEFDYQPRRPIRDEWSNNCTRRPVKWSPQNRIHRTYSDIQYNNRSFDYNCKTLYNAKFSNNRSDANCTTSPEIIYEAQPQQAVKSKVVSNIISLAGHEKIHQVDSAGTTEENATSESLKKKLTLPTNSYSIENIVEDKIHLKTLLPSINNTESTEENVTTDSAKSFQKTVTLSSDCSNKESTVRDKTYLKTLPLCKHSESELEVFKKPTINIEDIKDCDIFTDTFKNLIEREDVSELNHFREIFKKVKEDIEFENLDPSLKLEVSKIHFAEFFEDIKRQLSGETSDTMYSPKTKQAHINVLMNYIKRRRKLLRNIKTNYSRSSSSEREPYDIDMKNINTTSTFLPLQTYNNGLDPTTIDYEKNAANGSVQIYTDETKDKNKVESTKMTTMNQSDIEITDSRRNTSSVLDLVPQNRKTPDMKPDNVETNKLNLHIPNASNNSEINGISALTTENSELQNSPWEMEIDEEPSPKDQYDPSAALYENISPWETESENENVTKTSDTIFANDIIFDRNEKMPKYSLIEIDQDLTENHRYLTHLDLKTATPPSMKTRRYSLDSNPNSVSSDVAANINEPVNLIYFSEYIENHKKKHINCQCEDPTKEEFESPVDRLYFDTKDPRIKQRIFESRWNSTRPIEEEIAYSKYVIKKSNSNVDEKQKHIEQYVDVADNYNVLLKNSLIEERNDGYNFSKEKDTNVDDTGFSNKNCNISDESTNKAYVVKHSKEIEKSFDKTKSSINMVKPSEELSNKEHSLKKSKSNLVRRDSIKSVLSNCSSENNSSTDVSKTKSIKSCSKDNVNKVARKDKLSELHNTNKEKSSPRKSILDSSDFKLHLIENKKEILKRKNNYTSGVFEKRNKIDEYPKESSTKRKDSNKRNSTQSSVNDYSERKKNKKDHKKENYSKNVHITHVVNKADANYKNQRQKLTEIKMKKLFGTPNTISDDENMLNSDSEENLKNKSKLDVKNPEVPISLKEPRVHLVRIDHLLDVTEAKQISRETTITKTKSNVHENDTILRSNSKIQTWHKELSQKELCVENVSKIYEKENIKFVNIENTNLDENKPELKKINTIKAMPNHLHTSIPIELISPDLIEKKLVNNNPLLLKQVKSMHTYPKSMEMKQSNHDANLVTLNNEPIDETIHALENLEQMQILPNYDFLKNSSKHIKDDENKLTSVQKKSQVEKLLKSNSKDKNNSEPNITIIENRILVNKDHLKYENSEQNKVKPDINSQISETVTNNSNSIKEFSSNKDRNMPLLVSNVPTKLADSYSGIYSQDHSKKIRPNNSRVIANSNCNEIGIQTSEFSSSLLDIQCNNINKNKTFSEVITISEDYIDELFPSLSSNKNPSMSLSVTNGSNGISDLIISPDDKLHLNESTTPISNKHLKKSEYCGTSANTVDCDVQTALNTVDRDVQTVVNCADANFQTESILYLEASTQTINSKTVGTSTSTITVVTMDGFLEKILPLYICYYYQLGYLKHYEKQIPAEFVTKSNKISPIWKAGEILKKQLSETLKKIIDLINVFEVENFNFYQFLVALNLAFPMDLKKHSYILFLIFASSKSVTSNFCKIIFVQLFELSQVWHYNTEQFSCTIMELAAEKPTTLKNVITEEQTNILKQQIISFQNLRNWGIQNCNNPRPKNNQNMENDTIIDNPTSFFVTNSNGDSCVTRPQNDLSTVITEDINLTNLLRINNVPSSCPQILQNLSKTEIHRRQEMLKSLAPEFIDILYSPEDPAQPINTDKKEFDSYKICLTKDHVETYLKNVERMNQESQSVKKIENLVMEEIIIKPDDPEESILQERPEDVPPVVVNHPELPNNLLHLNKSTRKIIVNDVPMDRESSSTDSGYISPLIENIIKIPENVRHSFYTCICGNPADLLCKCGGAIYCSPICQALNWNNHSSVCQGTNQ